MKKVFVLSMALVLSGCGLTEAIAIGGSAVTVACATTSKEGRADIRERYNLPTDICGDLQKDE